MSADKVQDAKLRFFGALYSDIMTGEHTADAKFDALIAAVRADEREQAVARFKKLPSDWGQMAEDAIVEAIRNA